MKSIIFILSLSTLSARGAVNEGCTELHNAQLRLDTHTLNIANASTTRTPEGGAYKKREVVCRGEECKIKKSMEMKTVYEPGHPDANRRGYVKYPDIDVKHEYLGVTMAAAEIKTLASDRACRSQLYADRDSLVIKYTSGKVHTDIFKLGKNNEVLSWARTFANGKRHMVDFTTRIEKGTPFLF